MQYNTTQCNEIQCSTITLFNIWHEFIVAKHTTVGYDFKNKPLYPKANADLRASTSLELHYIHKEDLQKILRAYQKFESYFLENCIPAYSICDEFEVKLCGILG